jgi:hypothetical protein
MLDKYAGKMFDWNQQAQDGTYWLGSFSTALDFGVPLYCEEFID